METITTKERLEEVLEDCISDREYLNKPIIGFKAETKQNTLNKGRGKTNTVANLFGIDIDSVVKHASGTALVSFGKKSYKETIIDYFVSYFKETQDLPAHTSKEIILEMIAKAEEEAEIPEDKRLSAYTPKKPSWGEAHETMPSTLKCYGEKRYLKMYFVAGTATNLKIKHTLDGSPIDLKDEKFSSFRKPKKTENKVAMEFFGIPFKFAYREYAFSSLTYFSCRGNKYKIEIKD